jgi:hypothetical protein
MAYMFKRERLVSIELSERLSADTLRKFGERRRVPIPGVPAPKRTLSTKQRDAMRKQLREISPVGPLSEETKRKISKAHVQRYQDGVIHWSKLARLKRVHAMRSAQSREYWRKFKELPEEEQRRLNLQKAASRRVRVYKKCTICGDAFDVIPSKAHQATCGKPECKHQHRSNKAKGRRHSPESIKKMSDWAKLRHELEGGLFGRGKRQPVAEAGRVQGPKVQCFVETKESEKEENHNADG